MLDIFNEASDGLETLPLTSGHVYTEADLAVLLEKSPPAALTYHVQRCCSFSWVGLRLEHCVKERHSAGRRAKAVSWKPICRPSMLKQSPDNAVAWHALPD